MPSLTVRYITSVTSMKLAREMGSAIIARAVSDGKQNFLGARWAARVVDGSPSLIKERVALRLLSLSPHYFYDRDIGAEVNRNRRSRQDLADALVGPHLTSEARILDYGCGPGYMACAVAERVRQVYAVDISSGVLACARALNTRSNITYLTPDQLGKRAGEVDLAYSFAVVQHLPTEVLVHVLELLARTIRKGGLLLVHFAEPGQSGWRTEDEWTGDRSLLGRARLRYGLNCFGRSIDEMTALTQAAGFSDVEVQSLSQNNSISVKDDICSQQLLTARR
jgi:SAM-dependent methyltransferase